MAMWLLTIQANMRTHGISLSDLAERNRFVIIYFSSPIYIYILRKFDIIYYDILSYISTFIFVEG